MQKEKRKFIVSYRGKEWESYAVSPAKAVNNVWWRYFKCCDPFTYTDVTVNDFDVWEAN